MFYFKIPNKHSSVIYREFFEDFRFIQNSIIKTINKSYIIKNDSINLICLLTIFFSTNSLKALICDGLKISYLVNYINLLNPKLVVTSIDNDPNFYKLKKFCPDVKFISFQNGFRRKKNDFFGIVNNEKKLSCDYFYTWGNNICNEYKKYIKTKYIILGSFKTYFANNYFLNKKKPLIYISSSKLDKNDKSEFIKQYYAYEKKLILLLCKYCLSQNIEFVILKRTSSINEELYFRGVVQNKIKFIKIPRNKTIKKYDILGDYEVAVSICSSLGLENLALGRKTVFFPPRVIDKKNILHGFDISWPQKTTDNNLYFFRNPNFKIMSNILNRAIKINTHDWRIRTTKLNKIILPPDKNKLDGLLKNLNKYI
jgi:surface carbohydrate biosynthesis protein